MVEVAAYGGFGGAQKAVDAEIDRIFFAASSVQAFDDASQRAAFRWLWLGRYLVEEPDEAFVALNDGAVCGYLVGSLSDPAPRSEFAELAYFQEFAPLTLRYPAHLHINVDETVRSAGIGAQLVEAFEVHARRNGVAGMHIVTGAGMRNVRFYERLGFEEVATAPRNGRVVVMLAKDLAS